MSIPPVGDNHDLEDAILTMRKAAVLAEDVQSAILGQAMRSLAALLLEDFKLTGRDTALNEAMQLTTLALNCSSVDAADGARILATHGSIFASRYDISRKTHDLEKTISSLQLAIQTWNPPDDGQFSVIVSDNLACVLSMLYDNTGRREDLNDAIESALQVAESGLSNYPSFMAKTGSNLASLLARQYEYTGQLDSFSNALFELRIIAEIAPEFSEIDAILSYLGRLASQQHALMAKLSTGKLEVSKGDYTKSFTFFIALSLIPVLSIVYHGSFYPLAMFLGGLLSNLTLQKYNMLKGSGDGLGHSFDSTADWIRKLYPTQFRPSSFTPTLISMLWVDIPFSTTSTGSDEETYNGDTLRRQQLVHATRFKAEYDQGQRNLTYPPRRGNRMQDDKGALGVVNQTS
jgi:tetratricopeptide (TPR) repeat protein